ncbi:MAG: DUF5663 domain-containing protein [Candidatus Buchananbacteria bacterium]
MDNEFIKSFLEKLVAEAGLDQMSPEFKAQYTAKLEEMLNQQLGLILLQNLDEAKRQEFQAMIDNKTLDNAKIQELADRIPDFDQKIKDGLMAFANDFIALASKGETV